MTDANPSTAAGLIGHGDREQPTPLRVGCSIQSGQERELIVDCLESFDAVTVSTHDPESLATVVVDCYVIDQSALDAVGQQLLDNPRPDHPIPCLLVTDDPETVLPDESTSIPDFLQPLITDVIASPIQETELRRRLRVLIEMRRQAKQLAWSNAHHQELLELLPEAVVLVSDGEIRYANTAAERLLGADESTLLDRQFSAFVAEADQDAAAELLATTQQSQTTEFVTLELTVDDESVTIEAAGTAIGLDDDAVELVCRDLTGREQREAQLELYEKAMDEASVGITITDARQTDNPLVYVNDEFERLTGVDREWMLGRNARFAQTPRTDPETVAEIREAVDNGEPIAVELLNQCADGTEWHNALDISPVHQDGELTHFLGFQRDVTATRAQRNQLAVLDRVLRHNLRNRLNVVMGHAETLTEGASTEAVPLHASTICETAEELLGLSDKTRRFREAIEADTETATATDLSTVLKDCLIEISDEQPEAVFECDVPNGIEIQPGKAIKFALTELLSNAVDHSEKEAPHVSIAVDQTDTEVTIRITDDGPGIPDDERQAFEDATETPTDHAIGIGLWLVRWAVDSAGGELDYAEADPNGSIVTLQLPSVSAAETTPQTPDTAEDQESDRI